MSVALAPIDAVIDALNDHGCNPRQSGDGWSARCPAHEDRNPSLSVSIGTDDKVVLHCHANCITDDVLRALELKMADLFPQASGSNGHRAQSRIVEVYPYTDEDGTVLFETVRFDPKDFRQRHPDGHGGHIWNINGQRRVPYRLPELVAAVQSGRQVWVAEGEKDCDALKRAGVDAATCTPMGAGKWNKVPGIAAYFHGADVVIVADKDPAGYKHAEDVRASLVPVAAKVIVVEAARGKDAADHLAAGLALEDFVIVDLDQQPEATPAEETSVRISGPPVLPDDFWLARRVFAQIRQAAHSRMTAPDGLLGAVLARVAVMTDHRVVLPAVVSRVASLNLIVGLVSQSGGNKGGSLDGAAELIPLTDLADHKVVEVSAGSGEGMTKKFFARVEIDDEDSKRKRYEWRQVVHGGLVRVDEGSMFGSLFDRRGQTTLETLRSAWSGERLGGSYADADRGQQLAPHTYRMAVVFGLQPELAAPLFADAHGGLPQRVMWFSTQPVWLPEIDEIIDWPGLLDWQPPILTARQLNGSINGLRRCVLEVDSAVQLEIRTAHRARQLGQGEGDTLDAHANLSRLKLAAILGVLDGRLSISDEDWALAEVIADTSTAVRKWTQSRVHHVEAEKRRQGAHIHAQREVAAAEAVDDARVLRRARRVARYVAEAVESRGHAGVRDITPRFGGHERGDVDDAIEAAIGFRWIRRDGDTFTLGESRPS